MGEKKGRPLGGAARKARASRRLRGTGLSARLERVSTGSLAHQPHFESPQFRHVRQPSISTTAAVLHFEHSCAPSG